MAGLKFNMKGLEDVLRNIDNLKDEVRAICEDELTATANFIVSDAHAAAPKDLGALRLNIVANHTGLDASVESKAEYSAVIEFGSGFNVNIPQYEGLDELAAYALQFKGQGLEGKHPVNIKGKWVMVPYQLNFLARPFFFPAVQKNTIAMIRRLKKELNVK